MLDVDNALYKLGRWSRWKVACFVIACLAVQIPGSWHMLSIVFLGMMPFYLCKLPENIFYNMSLPQILKDGVWQLDQCNIWVNYSSDSNQTETCPNGVAFAHDEGLYTIVNEWNLVCDQSYLVETSQTILVVGVMAGAMATSVASDMFGRKITYLGSVLAISAIGFITAWVPNYIAFATLRFFTGFFQQGIVLAGFVYICELFPASQRTEMGLLMQIFWSVAMSMLALMAYFIRHWRHLLLSTSIPGILAIPLLWVMPESIPWLVAKNHVRRAKQTIAGAYKFSRVRLPYEFAMTEEEEALHIEEEKKRKERKSGSVGDKMRNCLGGCCKCHQKEKKHESSEDKAANYSFLDVICSWRLLSFALIMSYIWCVNGLVYYGLSLSTGNLAGNPYLNFALSGIVEAPAYALAAFVLKRYGRRWPIFAFHLVAGIPLFITLFIPNNAPDGTNLKPLIVTLSLIGKFGIAGSFGSVFLYAPELFPTTVRNVGIGIASVGGRIGNVAAPFSSLVARHVSWLPNVVFGVLAIIAGLLTLLLPETLNRPLPRTIEEIEKWTRTISKEEKARFKAEQRAQREMKEMEDLSRKANPEEKKPLEAENGKVADPEC